MINATDIIPGDTFFGGKPIRIIVPTSSLESEKFKKCLDSVRRSQLPNNSILTAVVSSGPTFSFARSINYALAMVNDENVLLLNDDCYVEPTTIKNMVDSITSNDGVIGGLLRYSNGKIQHNGGLLYFNTLTIFFKDLTKGAPFNTIRSALEARRRGVKYVRAFHRTTTRPGSLDFVTGALFFIPNAAFRKIGLLDEDYVNGFEDADYCLRARKMGLAVRVEASASAVHEEHASLNSVKSHFFDNISVFGKKWKRSEVEALRD
ncbi:Glycosyl transferase family 2 [Thermoplasmatales archaeon]|nr:Glycosyl transferase family 2 [Thermoplasmatales archaeon]